MTVRVSKFISIIIIIIIFFTQCKSADKVSFNSKNLFSNNTHKEIESNDKIDRWKTFEVFFNFKKDEECIKINLSSQIYDENLNKNINLKIFFIVEKAIDISKFSSDRKIIYSEIGRNYDYNWNTKQEIDICSSEMDPIKILHKSDTFRIRFTSFRDINYKYSVNIYSKEIINISEKKPDLVK